MNSIELFSAKRLCNYTSETEHRDNFLIMQKLAPKLGILEIVTRNGVAKILEIDDDIFISQQIFGYWVKVINERRWSILQSIQGITGRQKARCCTTKRLKLPIRCF